MSEWLSYKLEDCADILDNMRIPVNEEERSNNPGETPYYGANGLQGYINGWLFDEPLILMAEDGGYFDEYSTRPVAYRVSGKSWVNNHAHVIRPKQEFDFQYLFYALEHKNIMPFIKGGTRAKLNQKELKEIQVEVPKQKGIQQEIGQILQAIDHTIKRTKSLIEKYQQVKAGLMHDLFTRGITADGKLRPSREQAPELYQDTAIGWIPKEWGIDKFGENIAVIDPNPSHRYPAEVDEGYPICSTENFSGENGFTFKKSKLVSESTFQSQKNRCQFKESDVVFARKGKLGLARRYGKGKKVFSHTVVLMKPSTKQVDANWLLWLSRSHWLLKAIDVTMNTNSGVPTLGVEFIKEITVPFPEISEQKLIDQSLDAISTKIEIEVDKREKLLKQKSGLMQDLLTGKVSVPIDEETPHV